MVGGGQREGGAGKEGVRPQGSRHQRPGGRSTHPQQNIRHTVPALGLIPAFLAKKARIFIPGKIIRHFSERPCAKLISGKLQRNCLMKIYKKRGRLSLYFFANSSLTGL
jgi:hypothetical protein